MKIFDYVCIVVVHFICVVNKIRVILSNVCLLGCLTLVVEKVSVWRWGLLHTWNHIQKSVSKQVLNHKGCC